MPTFNFKTSSGTDLGNLNLGWITKDYLMSVYPQIANQLITPELWTWGFNTSGQLGDNTITNRSTPVTTFAGGTNWKQVSGGREHTAAIKTDGTLWTWGFNSSGQLGDNTTTNRSTPVTTFAGGTNWKQVSCAGDNTAAIKTDGTLWTWGYNFSGQLGNNVAFGSSILTPITTFAGGTNWKQVSCGNFATGPTVNTTAAIKTDGTLWVWGYNNNGQVGNNRSTFSVNTPVTTFAGGTNWKQVSCGRHTAAIKTDGTLWTWGHNGYVQLGNNTSVNRSTPVTTFAGGTNWKQVACGNAHTVAIKTDGTLWIWGRNTNGQLGNNTTTDRSTPVTTFAGGTNWKQVSGGNGHTAAIKTDGTLWTWGVNTNGQLGDNTTTQIITPVTTFAGGTNWKQVSGGYTYVSAIRTSDDLQGI
jgi:alpha-tubulin suppressor-like RCC1 family protein